MQPTINLDDLDHEQRKQAAERSAAGFISSFVLPPPPAASPRLLREDSRTCGRGRRTGRAKMLDDRLTHGDTDEVESRLGGTAGLTISAPSRGRQPATLIGASIMRNPHFTSRSSSRRDDFSMESGYRCPYCRSREKALPQNRWPAWRILTVIAVGMFVVPFFIVAVFFLIAGMGFWFDDQQFLPGAFFIGWIMIALCTAVGLVAVLVRPSPERICPDCGQRVS